ncbi:MAG TPA: NUDIX hydrolase [Nocardioidaceae bacterium]|nr:NUDIX hydrolase [Nocardioidaceae bacterium]
MDLTRRVPRQLVEQAQAFLNGDRAPAAPRDAATVVLLRPDPAGEQGVEVYLLRRHLGMEFAGGMYVFPGGGVDDRDQDSEIAWVGPPAREWAERLACSESRARALVCAAVRETFEESGVLLAGPTSDSVVADTTGEDWERDRLALVDRELSFAAFLHRRSLVLRSDLLAAWTHWITPEFEPRRYDTRFFVAVLPTGQVTRDVSTESDKVSWMRPREALASVDDGGMQMLPPTYVTLQDMAALTRPGEVLRVAAERVIRPILPTLRFDDGGAVLSVE